MLLAMFIFIMAAIAALVLLGTFTVIVSDPVLLLILILLVLTSSLYLLIKKYFERKEAELQWMRIQVLKQEALASTSNSTTTMENKFLVYHKDNTRTRLHLPGIGLNYVKEPK